MIKKREKLNRNEFIGGKAENLIYLKEILEELKQNLETKFQIIIPKFTILSAEDLKNLETLESKIIEFLENNKDIKKVAVRSSGIEDAEQASFAGAFLTSLNIQASLEKIKTEISKIKQHFEERKEILKNYASKMQIEFSDELGIIIQEMVETPDQSGVIFSCNPEFNDGYIHINFAKGLGERIVSGLERGIYIRIKRGFKIAENIKKIYPFLEDILKFLKLAEQIYQNNLDIEFSIKNNAIYILQIRPLVRPEKQIDEKQEKIIKRYVKFLTHLLKNKIKKDFLGDMIDINPRELLGERPLPLNYSIFNFLFGEKIVEKARKELGYTPLFKGLLENIAGKPFVSLESSAFSFNPKIRKNLYEKIFEFYLEKINKYPELQDKVEFELFAMDIDKNLEEVLNQTMFNQEEKREIISKFRNFKAEIDEKIKETIKNLNKKIEDLKNEMICLSENNLFKILEIGQEISLLFTKVARMAFLRRKQVEDMNLSFEISLKGLTTVASELNFDLYKFLNKEKTKKEIIQKYGHLRAGQFDLSSQMYEKDPERYFRFSNLDKKILEKRIKTHQKEEEDFLNFYKNLKETEKKLILEFRFLMTKREELKFLISYWFKHLEEKLRDISKILQIPYNLILYADIYDLIKIERSLKDKKEISKIKKLLERKKEKYELKKNVQLPDYIGKENYDISSIIEKEKQGIFIGNEIVQGEILYLKEKDKVAELDLNGKIILIDTADPGYDWIFTYNIKGLITKIGGPASHMAIRCVELKIPACIGLGERFENLKNKEQILLDCRNKKIL